MKPGKPLLLAIYNDMVVFGLATLSHAMVGFLQFVRPLIRVSLRDPQPFASGPSPIHGSMAPQAWTRRVSPSWSAMDRIWC